MSLDLTQLLQDTISKPLINYVTEQLGETTESATQGVTAVIPALLGSLLKNSDDNNKMTELFNLVTGPNISSEVSQVAPNMLEQGKGLLDTLLGNTDTLSQTLSTKTGMSLTSIGSLLAAALPMLLGTLRTHIQSENLTQPQFVHLLDAQKGFLAKLLDGDFLGALGLGALAGTVGGAVTDTLSGAADTAQEAASAVAETVSDAIAPVAGGASAWGVLIGSAIVTVLLASFCTGKTPAASSSATAASTTTDTAAVIDTANTTQVANNEAANADTSPAESNSDTSTDSANTQDAAVQYADGVLSVYFATGKTDFDTELAQKIATEIVDMGKSGKKLAVSGYNDPSGNAKLNAELSKNRAKSVRNFLIAQGVPADNVELVKPEETTGASGSNAQDRRVDVRIQP